MHERFHKIFPMQFLRLTQSSKHLEESTIEPLNRISSEMIWSCMYLLYASNLTKFPDRVRLKVRALIAEQSLWEAVMYYNLSQRHLATVQVRWFGVRMGNAYFVKWSVMTSAPFVLDRSGSNDKKSMHTSSRGRQVFILTSGAAISGGLLRRTHLSQVLISVSMAVYIFWPVKSGSH